LPEIRDRIKYAHIQQAEEKPGYWLCPKNMDFHKSEAPRALQLLSENDAAVSFIINSSREDKKAIFTEQL